MRSTFPLLALGFLACAGGAQPSAAKPSGSVVAAAKATDQPEVDESARLPCLVVCGSGCDGDWFTLTCETGQPNTDVDCDVSYSWTGEVLAVDCRGSAQFDDGASYEIRVYYSGEDECFSSVEFTGVGKCISS